MTDTPFYTDTRAVTYHADASALFEQLATPHDAVLLESTDIESKKNLNCIAILSAAVRVTCTGQRVRAQALTDTGRGIVARVAGQLADYLVDSSPTHAEFEFTRSQAHDERERLKATSTVEVVRKLQLDGGYSTEFLPFLGGGLAFDYLETFESLPPVSSSANTYPDYEFVVAQTLLHIDHLSRTAMVTGVNIDKKELDAELSAVAKATEDGLGTAAEASTPGSSPGSSPDCAPGKAPGKTPGSAAGSSSLQAVADIDDEAFRGHVRRLQDNITAGDIYQVVPARTFTMPCASAFAAYRELRETNPSPYMFFIRGRDYELFGASPESNLKFDADSRQVELYPIAGTCPRGLNPDGSINHELDIRNELEMRTNQKELAEHTMLVDLARNDLARVAVPGTRKVADLLQVDRYSRVMHLVSRVTATLHPDFDALDAYRACMNMGTLTGAPKLRAIELIRDTEGTRRGSYGGAVGYLRGDGSMDTCIVIRSAFVRDGVAAVQAGAGVVRDSTPEGEADETVHKAYAVLHAIALSHDATLEVVR